MQNLCQVGLILKNQSHETHIPASLQSKSVVSASSIFKDLAAMDSLFGTGGAF
jgi:hypothetical protein